MGCQREQIEQMIRRSLWESGRDGVVVGISGGVDSAVAAALCVGAIGRERVLGLVLPTGVTSEEDQKDAEQLCRNRSIECRTISIEPVVRAFQALPGTRQTPYLLGNLAARTRMATLYLVANAENRLVCGTSNKSEYLLGYFTKHGDGAADIQPILHLYKTQVYALARELDIPESIRAKPPSAGLWGGQSDEQELGLSYAVIDAALISLEEHGWAAQTDAEERVLQMVQRSEHKRLPTPSLLYTK
jgi:NAD+ synthase